jgi:NADH-quinone oxidoreductase subunit G
MSEDVKVAIEIDGISLEASPGQMLIEVADAAGIDIPRFCYHDKLSVAANCRMCLVEVEKAPKPMPACATPVMDGMVVKTRSPLALAAQKSTMEFLLINHPLDCPVCDQGGECELQDVAMGYGGDVSQYSEGKRVIGDRNIGPLIATEMTRCIHCTRCVRFGQEIAGIRELGATGRGEHTTIGTYIEQSVDSEMSGNVIDLCPVGALTARPSRYSARAWELVQSEGIAAHDCVGSNIFVHGFRGEVNRVVPRDNETINECWLSDRDRFSYEGLKHESRLQAPMIRQDAGWKEVSWESALDMAARKLKQAGDDINVMVSPNATVEEMYLLGKLARGLGSHNIDHRLRQSDFNDQQSMPACPGLGLSLDELEQQDAVLLVGSNVRKEQPIIAHRIRKAALAGGKIMFINTRDYDHHFPVAASLTGNSSQLVEQLAAVTRAVLDVQGKPMPTHLQVLLETVEPDGQHKAVAEKLLKAGNAAIILGTQAGQMPAWSALVQLATELGKLASATTGFLTDGANAAGAWLAGAVPHRHVGGTSIDQPGKSVADMAASHAGASLLFGIEPELDCANPANLTRQLRDGGPVIVMTSYVTDEMKDYADVLLPVAPFAETSGTFVNTCGEWQSFAGACSPLGETRPGWKVIRVLANMCDVEDFDYVASTEVLDEVREIVTDVSAEHGVEVSANYTRPETTAALERVSAVPLYAVDAVVRRSAPLQKTGDADPGIVRVNRKLADKLGFSDVSRVLVKQDGLQSSMGITVDDAIPDGCVWVPAANNGSAALGPMYGPVELEAD